MPKGKSRKYKLVSLESNAECGHLRLNPQTLDKAKRYMRFDKTTRTHTECKIVPISKGGTKALQNSKKAEETK